MLSLEIIEFVRTFVELEPLGHQLRRIGNLGHPSPAQQTWIFGSYALACSAAPHPVNYFLFMLLLRCTIGVPIGVSEKRGVQSFQNESGNAAIEHVCCFGDPQPWWLLVGAHRVEKMQIGITTWTGIRTRVRSRVSESLLRRGRHLTFWGADTWKKIFFSTRIWCILRARPSFAPVQERPEAQVQD